MRVGVWMPTAMPFELERSFFLDWVRLADQAGFDTLSSLDRPNYDMWDPLASFAAAAAVTQRIRLATPPCHCQTATRCWSPSKPR
jgi:alkanesulfonate monooxygenase SsuD/methylene tetrahydromethanopterin reductase-like flavin-dependent oxidoreductase (luciferase family)